MANTDEPQFSSLSARIAALAEQGIGTSPKTSKHLGKRPALPSRHTAPSTSSDISRGSLGSRKNASTDLIAQALPPIERGKTKTPGDLRSSTVAYRMKAPPLPVRKPAEIRLRSSGSATSLAQAGSATVKSITDFARTPSGSEVAEPKLESLLSKNLKAPPRLPLRASSPSTVAGMTVNKIPPKPVLRPRKIDQQGKIDLAESIQKIPQVTKAKLEIIKSFGDQERAPKANGLTPGQWINEGLSQELTTSSLNHAIKEKITFVMFYVRSCKNCQQVGFQWKQLAKHYAFASDKLLFGQVDLDSNPILRSRYSISTYPTMILFNGRINVPQKFTGTQPTTLEAMTEFLVDRCAAEVVKPVHLQPPPINLSSKPSAREIRAIQLSKVTSKSSKICLRCRDFSEPDKVASQYIFHCLPQVNNVIEFLADVLCRPFELKVDKTRAIFTWLHHNIAYDVDAFFGNCVKHSEPRDTIASGLAVCGGYAGVFEAIAREAGLEVITITGHGKGYGYTPMQPGDPVPAENPSGHAWNAVRLDDGEWKLLDSCWGAGTVTGTAYTKNFAPRHFTCSNDEFGLRHFPQGDYFFRADGLRPSWADYMRGLGPTDQEPVQELGNVEDDYGLSLLSFSPPNKYIRVAGCGEHVRFQFSKICEHFDFERHRTGQPPLFLLCLHGSEDPWLPLHDNGFWWWIDVPRSHLHAGQKVGCFVLTTVDGREAGGITKERYLQIKGRLAMGFSGVCIWELV
ncbi:hypothetical protein K3495_g4735 [Podosphaera aphanis]|nr:hypothetical protein K3495_g4735 [Podosphaera aphanis]